MDPPDLGCGLWCSSQWQLPVEAGPSARGIRLHVDEWSSAGGIPRPSTTTTTAISTRSTSLPTDSPERFPGQVKLQIVVLLLAGLLVSYGLDLWAGHTTPVLLLLALGGSFVSFIYSAPPLKLKQNGWLGNYALGASYIALPWWAGQALFGQLTWPTALLTLAYSRAGLGIAVVNDFKSVEGDRALGLQSLPVAFGIQRASWISAGMIDVFQLAMVAVLIGIGQHFAAVLLVLLIIPQITFQDIWLLRDPVAFDVKYQASAQPFLVLGMLVTALAVGHRSLIQVMEPHLPALGPDRDDSRGHRHWRSSGTRARPNWWIPPCPMRAASPIQPSWHITLLASNGQIIQKLGPATREKTAGADAAGRPAGVHRR